MPRGKKAFATPRIEREFSLPADLVAKIDLLYTDPLRGKPRYGAWAKLLETLLSEYLSSVLTGQRAPIGLINLPSTTTKES